MILHGYHYRYYNFIKYTQKQIDVYKKKETASKGKQHLFLSYKILLYYSSV